MKTFILSLTLFFAVGATAQDLPDYSNYVGILKVSIPARAFVFIGIPFEAGEAVGLNEVIGDQLTGGTSYTRGSDNILVWDTPSQTYKSFWKDSATGEWKYAGFQILADVLIEPGSGFWIQSRSGSDQSLVMSGNVPNQNVSIPTSDGFNQFGFPYPTRMSINDANFALSAAAKGGTSYTRGSDNLMIWNVLTGSYVSLWKGEGLSGADAVKNEKWMLAGTRTVADITLEPGQGFWFKKNTPSLLNWEPLRPYDLEN